ncbi:Copper transport protein ATX1 [Smittium mucronatum]|uniref:Copper transport protein ATX1 n=1 Tax=Smittium mucronatum TaxID=133383 RepID=A0A1R0H2J6_9FUNG|nr:Copper transport protein ATX1 [Smittium mucronatum]
MCKSLGIQKTPPINIHQLSSSVSKSSSLPSPHLSQVLIPPKSSSLPSPHLSPKYQFSFLSCNTYKFKVAMNCNGCSGSVKRVLDRLDGVQDVDIDLPSQTVSVTTSLPQDTIFQTIRKTGKQTEIIS